MSALTSLLVRDQRVPVRKIEEAIQRQVISGGRLDTVLLELKLVEENVLSAYLGVIHDLLPATRDEVMKVPRDIVRMVPKEVAGQHRMVPLSCEDRTLCVAVADPLDPATESQLGFLLGVELVQRVVTTVRISAGLHHHYGVDVVPRMRRLIDKLRKVDAGSIPYVAPLVQNVAEGRVEVDDDDYGYDEDEEESGGGVPTKKFGVVASIPAPPPIENDQPVRVRTSQVVGVRRSTRPPPPGVPSAPPPPPPQHKRVAVPSSELVRAHRGPMTARRAVELLGEARTRDEILEVIFAFLKQFFDYMVVFVVQDGEAEGLDAIGGGAVYEDVQKISVPLDQAGVIALSVEGVVPLVTHLDQTDADRRLRGELLRDADMPAVIIPIAIRSRVVLLAYGDRSGDDFGLADIPEVLAFSPRVSEAFQQLILRRKFSGYEKGEAQPDIEPADSRTETLRPPPVDQLDPPDTSPGELTSPGSIPPPPPVDMTSIEGQDHIVEAIRSSLPPPPDPEPDPKPKKKLPRTHAMDVLGVPRSAPPPPKPGSQPEIVVGTVEASFDETRLSEVDPIPGRTTDIDLPPAHELHDDDDEPEISVEDPDDDEPDITIDEAEDDDELLAELESAGHYKMSGGSEQVRRGRRRDPRSAGGKPRAKVDVVKLDGVTPTASPRTRSGRPDSEPPGPVKRRSSPDPMRSSVIVDMGDDVENMVEDLKTIGPEDGSHAVPQIVSLGEVALPVLVREFPGPLWFDRHRPHRRLPRGRDISAIARTMVAFGDRAVPYVGSLLDRNQDDVRFYATLLASEYKHRDLVAPLGRRVFDADKGTATLGLDVLRQLSHFDDELQRVLEMIRATARVPRRTAEQRAQAVFALRELRDARALDLLIELLGSNEDRLADAAHEALQVLTRQDFGRSRRKWEEWAEANSDRHRVEWLIDGLLHPDEAVRSAAGDELKHLTQEYYGYHPSLSRREREIAQRKYRRWWESEGQRRFQA